MPLQAHAKTVALSISSEESQAQQGGVALAEHRDEVLAQALNARSSSPGGAIATTSASLRVTQQPRQFSAKVQIDRRRREIHAGVERREWHAISMAHELIQKESDPQMSGLDEELLAESLVRRLYKEGGAIGDHIRFQQAVKATWRQLGIGLFVPCNACRLRFNVAISAAHDFRRARRDHWMV